MKVYWDKIPRCFKYAALDRDDNVTVNMQKPTLKELCADGDKSIMDWTYPMDSGHDILRDFRYLIEHDEYELDGTEDWKYSLQERPADIVCTSCKGNHTLVYPETEHEEASTLICNHCEGTGVEP